MPSYSPVFSQGFLYYTNSTPNQTFDVPLGFTAVVREVIYYCEAGGGLAVTQIATGPGAPYVTISTLTIAGIETVASWTGRAVVPGGGSIYISGESIGLEDTIYVGGYLLRNSLS